MHSQIKDFQACRRKEEKGPGACVHETPGVRAEGLRRPIRNNGREWGTQELGQHSVGLAKKFVPVKPKWDFLPTQYFSVAVTLQVSGHEDLGKLRLVQPEWGQLSWVPWVQPIFHPATGQGSHVAFSFRFPLLLLSHFLPGDWSTVSGGWWPWFCSRPKWGRHAQLNSNFR